MKDKLYGGFALSAIPIVTGTITDNADIGTLVACVSRTMNATANTDTVLSHTLGRTPNGYIALRSRLGGLLYDGSNHGSDWSPTQVVLRSTVASDVVTFLLW